MWSAARSLSRSIDKQLFYNGAGILVMRNHSRAVKYVFKPGHGRQHR
ncbi:hypothetical protein [Promicromonospora kroppenstedtii]|nr:hypothetical protein [Promicromonospora kroppenstedtii]